MRRNDRNEATEAVLYYLGAADDNRAWLCQLMAETQPEDLADRLREETPSAIWYGIGAETNFLDWTNVDWKHVAVMCKAGPIPGPEVALGGGPGVPPIIAMKKLLTHALPDCTSPDQLADELRTRAARVKGSDTDFAMDWRRVARNILETSETMITTAARERLAAAFAALRGAEVAHEAERDPDRPNALTYALATLEIKLRDAAHALDVMYRMRGHTLDRLAAQVVADATEGTKDAHLRLQGIHTSDYRGDDPTRLALRAAAHGLELADYAANIEEPAT